MLLLGFIQVNLSVIAFLGVEMQIHNKKNSEITLKGLGENKVKQGDRKNNKRREKEIRINAEEHK